MSEPTDGEGGDGEADPPVVLAVDDEERDVQAFQLWLGDAYRIVTATGGETAMERLDESVDVVLLDRHMPGVSGEAVLERIRESPHDPWIVMVTAVDPDFDLIDMPFDEYLSKPVGESELRSVVDRLLRIDDYDDRINELYTVTRKIAALRTELTNAELRQDERYLELLDRQERLRADADDLVSELSDDPDSGELQGLLFEQE